MKKSIIALMGLFMLMACSEDAYQEADKLNEPGNVENTGPQNQVYTHDPSIPYDSPYDLGSDRTINYIFKNNTDVELTFHPWVSLCYYDGINDTNHFSFPINNPTLYPVFNILPSPVWNEYDNKITAKIIKIPPYTTETITTTPGMNLPADPSGPKTASGQFFEFGAYAVSTTPQEIALLSQYGKFIGLESNFGAIKFSSLPPGMNPNATWQSVPVLPGSTLKKLYNTSSMEVCTVVGGIANHPSTNTVVFNGMTYTLSAYTTSTDVIVEFN